MNDTFDISLKSSTKPITSDIDHDAPHIQMSKWTLDDWEAPLSFSSFAILSICPEAPKIFAEAGHFTTRDLRAIVSHFNLPVDHKNTYEVYRTLLEATQFSPWIFAAVETVAADNRGQYGSQKNKKKSVSEHVVSKMPLSKLRLRAHPDLHDRVSELKMQPVDPALAVAAFAEYAITSYVEIRRGRSVKSLSEEASRKPSAKAVGAAY